MAVTVSKGCALNTMFVVDAMLMIRWLCATTKKQVPRHDDRMACPLGSFSVEWFVHYFVLHRGMVEGGQRCTSSKTSNTQRVDDREEEAAEYRRHD